MSENQLIWGNIEEFSTQVAIMAQRALLEEVMLWPKPGLVDPISNGAHKDMDATSFVNSATALFESFKDFTKIGMNSINQEEQELVKSLKLIGIRAEKEMLKATGGVNTHKGIIFSFGYLLGAIGYTKASGKVLNLTNIISKVKSMAQGLVEKELGNLSRDKQLTNGEKLYLKYKIAGARAEVEQGFPNAMKAYDILLEENTKQTRLKALLTIMENNDDTNVISRGGINALDYIKEKSKAISSFKEEKLIRSMEEFDKECIKSNISPGGSADLLSVALLLVDITKN